MNGNCHFGRTCRFLIVSVFISISIFFVVFFLILLRRIHQMSRSLLIRSIFARGMLLDEGMANDTGRAPSMDRNESSEEPSPAARAAILEGEVVYVVGGCMVCRVLTHRPNSPTPLLLSSLDIDDDVDDRSIGWARFGVVGGCD
ncbi:hypothetical protein GYMLUDRAFT_464551 [Collybiopsis luxurians FD-317 M1]|uniref:Uncharacterized protein n=1 Tax=Collybiopsis luxurians FD-317 M1 TaxID=944289 RepID=A0A0D0C5A8_9AGAR|nr:hypothetical protein GYMLUDRAFT_464551 [Collybiopsis luxurians FD-317 M1]